jgi:hypothetical protein
MSASLPSTAIAAALVAVLSTCDGASPKLQAPAPQPRAPGVAGDQAAQATLRLTAWCAPGAAEPSALEVALSLPLEGTPVFRLDDDVYGSSGMAKLISGAEASDDNGPLPLVRRVAAGVELAAKRAAVGAVTLRYRARSVGVAEPGARHGLRHDSTGIGGLGAFFLILPESRRVYRIRIEWAPPACGGTHGMSSFGPDVAETTGELATLRMAAYFIGRPQVFSADAGSMHVRSAWFGQQALDAAAAAEWAARAFAAERAVFADDDPAPYHIFVRVLPAMGDRSNGMGQPSSFIAAIGPLTSFGPRLRINMAHEMLHRWIGLRLRLGGPDGSSFWFTEGFTVHYASLLMLRAALISPEEFLAELNGAVTRQFSNVHASATNEEIRRGFFDDDALSVVPYTRGSLYAAELDTAIRRASRGARSLDSMMRALYQTALSAPVGEAGLRELPPAAFRQAVLRELGQPGVDRFDAVIVRGAPPDPPSDAYGPCFQRVPRAIPPFQLGFDDKQSLAEPKAIRKLVAGSAAASAGLIEGDELVSVESSFLVPDKEAVVTVKRGGKTVVVRYLPASSRPKREGFAWVRVNSVPDARCGEPTRVP